VKAPATVVAVRFEDRKIPLFTNTDGTRSGLVPVSALVRQGQHKLELIDGGGQVLETAILNVENARFQTQNVQLTPGLSALKPAPGEMETLAALRNTVSPIRYWSEPFEKPVPGCLISPFGVQRLHNGKPTGNYHSGLDQRGAEGVPIRAISAGVVKIVRKFNVNGDIVGIDHGQGVTSFYLHMSKFATTEGALVKAGDTIGYVGSTGRSTAPHLHWAIDVHAVPVNPLQWMTIPSCHPAPAKPKQSHRATAGRQSRPK